MERKDYALRRELEEIEALGFGEFDPALFLCIKSMVTRAEALPERAKGHLESRIRERLEEFNRIRVEKREEAASALEKVRGMPREAEIKEAFGQGDYRAVLRLYRRLNLRRDRVRIRLSSNRADTPDYIRSRRDVAQLNLRAELEESIGTPVGAEDDLDGEGWGGDEMLSFQLFREAAAEHRAGKELGRATQEGPDNPGPLNGYALTTTTLEHIKELSPVYLKRFVKWLDALAALYALPDRNSRS